MALQFYNFNQIGEEFQKTALDFFKNKVAKDEQVTGAKTPDQLEEAAIEKAKDGMYYIFQDSISLVTLETIQECASRKQRLLSEFSPINRVGMLHLLISTPKGREVISTADVREKLEYIKEVYDDNLKLKTNQHVEIINWFYV